MSTQVTPNEAKNIVALTTADLIANATEATAGRVLSTRLGVERMDRLLKTYKIAQLDWEINDNTSRYEKHWHDQWGRIYTLLQVWFAYGKETVEGINLSLWKTGNANIKTIVERTARPQYSNFTMISTQACLVTARKYLDLMETQSLALDAICKAQVQSVEGDDTLVDVVFTLIPAHPGSTSLKVFSKALQSLMAAVRRLLEAINTIEITDDDAPMTPIQEENTKSDNAKDATGTDLQTEKSDTAQGSEFVLVDAEMSRKRKPDSSCSESENEQSKAPKKVEKEAVGWKADLERMKKELSAFYWHTIVFTHDTVVARNIASETARCVGKVTLTKRNDAQKRSKLGQQGDNNDKSVSERMRSSALGELIAAGTKQNIQSSHINTDMELDQSDEEDGNTKGNDKGGKGKNSTVNRILADNDRKREQWTVKKGGKKGGKNWQAKGHDSWQHNRGKQDASSSSNWKWHSNWDNSDQQETEKKTDDTPKNPMKKKTAPIGATFKEKNENFLKTSQGWIHLDGEKAGQIWVQKP